MRLQRRFGAEWIRVFQCWHAVLKDQDNMLKKMQARTRGFLLRGVTWHHFWIRAHRKLLARGLSSRGKKHHHLIGELRNIVWHSKWINHISRLPTEPVVNGTTPSIGFFFPFAFLTAKSNPTTTDFPFKWGWLIVRHISTGFEQIRREAFKMDLQDFRF